MKRVSTFFIPILLTIIIFTISYMILTLLLAAFSLPQTLDIRNIQYVYIMSITALITCAFVWFVYHYIHKQSVKNLGFTFKNTTATMTLVALFIMTLGYIVYIYYSNNIVNLTTWSPPVNPIHIIQLLLIYLGVSINEEILFRGYLHNFFKKHNILLAYFISVPLFLAPHFITRELDLTYLMSLFSATIMLTLIYDLSGSIWPGIILHFFLNSYLALLSLGINSGSIISIQYLYHLERSTDLLRISETIINIIIIIFVLGYYIVQKKNTNSNLFNQ